MTYVSDHFIGNLHRGLYLSDIVKETEFKAFSCRNCKSGLRESGELFENILNQC